MLHSCNVFDGGESAFGWAPTTHQTTSFPSPPARLVGEQLSRHLSRPSHFSPACTPPARLKSSSSLPMVSPLSPTLAKEVRTRSRKCLAVSLAPAGIASPPPVASALVRVRGSFPNPLVCTACHRTETPTLDLPYKLVGAPITLPPTPTAANRTSNPPMGARECGGGIVMFNQTHMS